MFGTEPFVAGRERLTWVVPIPARDGPRDGGNVLFAARPLDSARGDKRGLRSAWQRGRMLPPEVLAHEVVGRCFFAGIGWRIVLS